MENNDIETIQLLLDNGAQADPRILHYSDNDWHSLITLRLATGNTAITELLLQYIDLEENMTAASVLDRDTLMVVSAACGLTTIVKHILDRKSHGDTKPWGSPTFLHRDHLEDSPLAWATFGGHKDIFALLLDHGANPYGRRPALTIAVSLGYAEIAQLLLDRGTDFNSRSCTMSCKSEAKCSLGICTLCRAIKFPQLFQALTEQGALVQDDSSDLVSLMAEVVRSGNVVLVQVLLDKGDPLKVHESDHPKPMLYCAVKGGVDMLNFLTTNGVLAFDPNDEYVKSILSKAVVEGRSKIVEYFLGRGCDPNSKLGTRRLYLEMAAQATNHEAAAATFDILLRHGADINQIPDTFGNFYSKFTQLDMFRLLLERGANIGPSGD